MRGPVAGASGHGRGLLVRRLYWSARIACTPAKRSSTSSKVALNSGSVLVVGVVSKRFPSMVVVAWCQSNPCCGLGGQGAGWVVALRYAY